MIYLVDLFCGGGGTSTGASMAESVKVIYCVNHDPIAIKSHAANHPDCIHAIEDIRTLDLSHLKKIIENIRLNDPTAVIGLWASLEDVYMRMFSEKELLRIMGFPEDYILCGNQTQNKKFIGNAVEVNQARVILETSAKSNLITRKLIA